LNDSNNQITDVRSTTSKWVGRFSVRGDDVMSGHAQLEAELKKLKYQATEEMKEHLFYDKKRINSFEGKITYMGILDRLIEVKEREDPLFAQMMEKRKNLNKKIILYLLLPSLFFFLFILSIIIFGK
jgi:hypothetical protein